MFLKLIKAAQEKSKLETRRAYDFSYTRSAFHVNRISYCEDDIGVFIVQSYCEGSYDSTSECFGFKAFSQWLARLLD